MEAHNATIGVVMKMLYAFYAVSLTILLTLHIAQCCLLRCITDDCTHTTRSTVET